MSSTRPRTFRRLRRLVMIAAAVTIACALGATQPGPSGSAGNQGSATSVALVISQPGASVHAPKPGPTIQADLTSYTTYWKSSCNPDWPGWTVLNYGHIGDCVYVEYQVFRGSDNLRAIRGRFLINNMQLWATSVLYVNLPGYAHHWGPIKWYNVTTRGGIDATWWVNTQWFGIGRQVPHGTQVVFVSYNASTGQPQPVATFTLP